MTEKYSYRRKAVGGRTKMVVNPSTEIEFGNPWVGDELVDFLTSFDVADSFVVAYIIENYGDEITDRSDSKLRESVVSIERRRYEDGQNEKNKDDLNDLIENANAAETERILEAARKAKSDADVDDVHTHEKAVNRSE